MGLYAYFNYRLSHISYNYSSVVKVCVNEDLF